MHKTSYVKAELFYKTYIVPEQKKTGGQIKVLDIGSKVYEGQKSYRDIFIDSGVDYHGLDLEHGENVSIVPENIFIWKEIPDESFDYCISGQTFEHNPFFWITFAEIARILKPGGMVLIIAPGRGEVHRYPVDCWRFYPDAWQSLCGYTGLDLVETLFEDYEFNHVQEGAEWCDSSVIARKPVLNSEAEQTAFYEQLAKVSSTLPGNVDNVLKQEVNQSKVFDTYSTEIKVGRWKSLRERFRRRKLSRRIFKNL